MAHHVYPRVHDKTTARERPIEGDLTAVASQARLGSDFDRVSGGVYQAPVLSYSTVVHAIVTRQFFGGRRGAVVFEIFGRTDYDPIVVDQPPHDEVRSLRRPNPDDHIYSLFNQVHYPIR